MKNTWIIRRLILTLALFWTGISLCAQERLNLHLDYTRFLAPNKDTVLLLDYQIPYRSLIFVARDGAYFAQVAVQVQISSRDSLLFEQSITDNIGIRSKHDALSNQKAYLNRMSFQLAPQTHIVQYRATDINSGRVFNWSRELEALPPTARISDVELNSRVYADSSSYLAKFQRKGKIYEAQPSIILNREYHEFAHLYLELYTPEEELGQSQLLMLSLEQDGEIVMDEYLDTTPMNTNESISLKLPLQGLAAGKYYGSISLLVGENLESRNFAFVLSEEVETMLNLFPNPDDEFNLMRYFLASRAPSNWTSMNEEAKRRHITNFWKSMALSTGMSEQRILDMVKDRVDHSNRYFSSLKPGWTTDMGRIYIRNGAPADIEKGTSSDESRFVRKDYQIWKYGSGNRAVYVFMDIQMNNNYRLIYVSGDDMELSNPDWLRFLGSDFDTSLLRN
jgi:GWxTD domain-containing protein